MESVYLELRKLAAAKLAQEAPGHTLDPTALVHEAYLKLAEQSGWDHRGHYFAAAAEAMRRILVDHARARNAIKRGGDLTRVPLNDQTIPSRGDDEILAVHEALEELTNVDAVAADLVKLRYFAGLSATDAAAALELPERTAGRLWAYARAWLRERIES
jgi:RNA polymerase sigma factor (TIGR02999 family)